MLRHGKELMNGFDCEVVNWSDKAKVFNRNYFKSLIGLLINVTIEAVLWYEGTINALLIEVSERLWNRELIGLDKVLIGMILMVELDGFINKCYW